MISAIEAWSGERLLGESMGLVSRPDVVSALGLTESARPGFEFFADFDGGPRDGFLLTIRARMVDGSQSPPLSQVRVQTTPAGIKLPRTDNSTVISAAATSVALSEKNAGTDDILPPAHLQTRQVGNVWNKFFYSEGRIIFGQLEAAFRLFNHPLEGARRVLDFGCGCCRVLRGFEGMAKRPEIWGCDIDSEAIEWNSRNLPHLGRFACNPRLPPTSFETGFFDAVYSVSVFTHLPEELQFAWLTELRRIVRPGGLLILSVHGAHYWQKAETDIRNEVEARGFVYRTGARTAGLPDFYAVAFHSPAYVRRKWSWFFEVVSIKEKLIHGVQDAVILRRRDDT